MTCARSHLVFSSAIFTAWIQRASPVISHSGPAAVLTPVIRKLYLPLHITYNEITSAHKGYPEIRDPDVFIVFLGKVIRDHSGCSKLLIYIFITNSLYLKVRLNLRKSHRSF